MSQIEARRQVRRQTLGETALLANLFNVPFDSGLKGVGEVAPHKPKTDQPLEDALSRSTPRESRGSRHRHRY